MDLLVLKLERIDNTFYENLLKFISEHGYTPKVVIRNTDCLSINGLKIVSSKRQLFRHKEEISMTNKEFDILELLARNKGQVFSKEQIYERVWNDDFRYANTGVSDIISSLRKKLGLNARDNRYIQTVHGAGYRFTNPE